MATLPSANGGSTTISSGVSTSQESLITNILSSDATGGTTAVTTVTGGSNLVTITKTDGSTSNLVSAPTVAGATTVSATVSGATVTIPSGVSLVTTDYPTPTITVPATAPETQKAAAVADEVTKNLTKIIGQTTGDVSADTVKSSAVKALTESVDKAVENALQGLTSASTNKAAPTNTNLVFARPVASDTVGGGSDTVVGGKVLTLDATGSTQTDLFAIDLSQTKNTAVLLKGVEAAVLSGPGEVRIDGNAPAVVTSSSQPQAIIAGGGNDTIVGSGNDTMTGGAGADTFGFAGNGKYVVSDFVPGTDKLSLQIPGVNNLDQLKAAVTSVSTTVVNGVTTTTYNFGPDLSVTLVGVTASQLTADMVKFAI